MPYCSSETLVKRDGELREGRVLKCRCWTCPTCQPDRVKRLIAEAIGGHPTTFITLTLRADDNRDRSAQAQALSYAWRIIRLRAMRRSRTTKLPFIAVLEATKAGTPHLHILARVRWLDQRWLSLQAAELLNAPIVDVRRIDAHRSIAGYVAKYVGKAPKQFGTSKRYWKSRDYELRAEWRDRSQHRPRSDFARVDRPLYTLAHMWQSWGLDLTWLTPTHVRAEPPTHGPPR